MLKRQASLLIPFLIVPFLFASDGSDKKAKPSILDGLGSPPPASQWDGNTFGAIQELPPLARLHFEMGMRFAEEEQWELAADAFRESLKEHPDFVGARLAIDKCLRNMPRFTRPDFTTLQIDGNGSPAEDHFVAAKRKIVNDDIKAAIVEFEKCLTLDEAHFQAQYNLGIAHHVTGNLSGAVAAFEKALALDEGHYLVWESKGVALALMNRSSEALHSFHKAVTINPGLASAHHSVGLVHSQRGDKKEALRHLRLAVVLQPSNKLYREHFRSAVSDTH